MVIKSQHVLNIILSSLATNKDKDTAIDSSEDDQDSDRSERGQSPFSNMSLDVLAQVASATLEKEPRPKELQPQRRVRYSVIISSNLHAVYV